MDNVNQFLERFLNTPSGKSPQAIRSRFQHWAEVYANPDQFSQDHSPHALAAKRKSARQCLRRLAERHPGVASELIAERVEPAREPQ